MAEDQDQEKTEPASARKRDKARRKGTVAVSREVPSVLILTACLGVFNFAAPWMFERLTALMSHTLGHLDSLAPSTGVDAAGLVRETVFSVFVTLTPILLAVLVAGVAGNLMQVGFVISFEPLAPNFEKFDPIKGMKKFVSLRSLVEVLKAVLKIVFVGAIGYAVVRNELQNMAGLMQTEVWQILAFVGKVAFKICLFVCLGLLVLAIADYAYQRWQYEKDLRMTKQEVKDEHKQTEGDPKVKARIRSIQRDLARRRMMAAVPEADVVITNPTHLAVALKFDPDTMAAPKVVAKGAGHLAMRIREIAEAHNVPRVENKPLARSLYKTVEIDRTIPVELYRAVAEILAYVYRLKRSRPSPAGA